MAENESSNGASSTEPQAQLNLQRLYTKDVSFEAPGSPQVFQQSGQPNVELNLAQRVTRLGDVAFEVVLTVTATCKIEGRTAYLAEVHQAGIFGATGFDDAGRETVLSTHCPNVLFPYARQMISTLVMSGGFPPLVLQPINFEVLYTEQMRRRAEAQQNQPDSGGAPN